MDDLISRQAAIEALEKVAELYPWRVPGDRDSYSQYNEAWQDALNRADSEIEALPPAQPEIIHCGDCRYWKNNHLCECLSKYGTFETEIYFYCGFAERRANG